MARYGDSSFRGNANSGRKTKAEELAQALNMGLANYIHNDELEKLKAKEVRTLEEIRTLVTPVTTKGIVERSENTLIIPQPLLGGKSNGSSNDSDQKTIGVKEED
jgi:hypothetical protein